MDCVPTTLNVSWSACRSGVHSFAPSPSVSRRTFQKRRLRTSCIIAKSFWPATPLIRKRRYSFGFGCPSTKTTIEPTAEVPWMFEMS